MPFKRQTNRIDSLEKKVISYNEKRGHDLDLAEKYYVYVMMDPRKEGPFTYTLHGTNDTLTFTHAPFYVGKGKARRMFQHLSIAKNPTHSKALRIKEIRRSGLEPIVKRITKFSGEARALAKEFLLTKSIGRECDGGVLTNIALGFHSSSGYKHTDAYKAMMSRINTGRSLSRDTCKKISNAKKGVRFSEEHKQKLADAKRGKPMSGVETLRKIWAKKRAATAKRRAEERKNRVDGRLEMMSKRNARTLVCPHCSQEGQAVAMKRWHFDNCKELENAVHS